MPVVSTADHSRYTVFTTFTGMIRLTELEQYQLEFWTDPELAGYNELMDLGDANFDNINYGDLLTLTQLASRLYRFNPGSRLAIVVHNKEHQNISDFYIAARAMTTTLGRETASFNDVEQAMNWLCQSNPAAGRNR